MVGQLGSIISGLSQIVDLGKQTENLSILGNIGKVKSDFDDVLQSIESVNNGNISAQEGRSNTGRAFSNLQGSAFSLASSVYAADQIARRFISIGTIASGLNRALTFSSAIEGSNILLDNFSSLTRQANVINQLIESIVNPGQALQDTLVSTKIAQVQESSAYRLYSVLGDRGSNTPVQDIIKNSRELSRGSLFRASDISAAQFIPASAGYSNQSDLNKIINASKVVATINSVGSGTTFGENLVLASETSTRVAKSFNRGANDIEDITAQLFETGRGSIATQQQILKYLPDVVAVGRQAGITDLSEILAAYSVLTQDFDPESAGTNFKYLLGDIITGQAQARLDQIAPGATTASGRRVDLSRTGLQKNGFVQTVKDLQEISGGNPEFAGKLLATQTAGEGLRSLTNRITELESVKDRIQSTKFKDLKPLEQRAERTFQGRFQKANEYVENTLGEAGTNTLSLGKSALDIIPGLAEFFGGLAGVMNTFVAVVTPVTSAVQALVNAIAGLTIAVTAINVIRSLSQGIASLGGIQGITGRLGGGFATGGIGGLLASFTDITSTLQGSFISGATGGLLGNNNLPNNIANLTVNASNVIINGSSSYYKPPESDVVGNIAKNNVENIYDLNQIDTRYNKNIGIINPYRDPGISSNEAKKIVQARRNLLNELNKFESMPLSSFTPDNMKAYDRAKSKVSKFQTDISVARSENAILQSRRADIANYISNYAPGIPLPANISPNQMVANAKYLANQGQITPQQRDAVVSGVTANANSNSNLLGMSAISGVVSLTTGLLSTGSRYLSDVSKTEDGKDTAVSKTLDVTSQILGFVSALTFAASGITALIANVGGTTAAMGLLKSAFIGLSGFVLSLAGVITLAVAAIAGLAYVGYDQFIAKPRQYQEGIDRVDSRITSKELKELYAIPDEKKELQENKSKEFNFTSLSRSQQTDYLGSTYKVTDYEKLEQDRLQFAKDNISSNNPYSVLAVENLPFNKEYKEAYKEAQDDFIKAQAELAKNPKSKSARLKEAKARVELEIQKRRYYGDNSVDLDKIKKDAEIIEKDVKNAMSVPANKSNKYFYNKKADDSLLKLENLGKRLENKNISPFVINQDILDFIQNPTTESERKISEFARDKVQTIENIKDQDIRSSEIAIGQAKGDEKKRLQEELDKRIKRYDELKEAYNNFTSNIFQLKTIRSSGKDFQKNIKEGIASNVNREIGNLEDSSRSLSTATTPVDVNKALKAIATNAQSFVSTLKTQVQFDPTVSIVDSISKLSETSRKAILSSPDNRRELEEGISSYVEESKKASEYSTSVKAGSIFGELTQGFAGSDIEFLKAKQESLSPIISEIQRSLDLNIVTSPQKRRELEAVKTELRKEQLNAEAGARISELNRPLQNRAIVLAGQQELGIARQDIFQKSKLDIGNVEAARTKAESQLVNIEQERNKIVTTSDLAIREAQFDNNLENRNQVIQRIQEGRDSQLKSLKIKEESQKLTRDYEIEEEQIKRDFAPFNIKSAAIQERSNLLKTLSSSVSGVAGGTLSLASSLEASKDNKRIVESDYQQRQAQIENEYKAQKRIIELQFEQSGKTQEDITNRDKQLGAIENKRKEEIQTNDLNKALSLFSTVSNKISAAGSKLVSSLNLLSNSINAVTNRSKNITGSAISSLDTQKSTISSFTSSAGAIFGSETEDIFNVLTLGQKDTIVEQKKELSLAQNEIDTKQSLLDLSVLEASVQLEAQQVQLLNQIAQSLGNTGLSEEEIKSGKTVTDQALSNIGTAKVLTGIEGEVRKNEINAQAILEKSNVGGSGFLSNIVSLIRSSQAIKDIKELNNNSIGLTKEGLNLTNKSLEGTVNTVDLLKNNNSKIVNSSFSEIGLKYETPSFLKSKSTDNNKRNFKLEDYSGWIDFSSSSNIPNKDKPSTDMLIPTSDKTVSDYKYTKLENTFPAFSYPNTTTTYDKNENLQNQNNTTSSINYNPTINVNVDLTSSGSTDIKVDAKGLAEQIAKQMNENLLNAIKTVASRI